MGMWGQIGSSAVTQAGMDESMGLTLIGRLIAQGDYDKANQIYQTIVESVSAQDLPAFKQMVAQQLGPSAQVLGQGQGRNAQSQAISNLQSFVDQNGLDAQARAANEEALGQADQRAQGARGALLQQYARRGMSGSGAEFGNMLQANQSSANQGRQSSLDIAGQARQRALQALGQQANIGGQMRGQDIDVESKNAAAQNARDEFNAKMRWAAQGANNNLMQEDFQNRMAKENALDAARSNMANRYDQGGQRTQKDWAAVGRWKNAKNQIEADNLEDMPF